MVGFIVFIIVMYAIGSGVSRNIREEQAAALFKRNGIYIERYRYNYLLTVISGLGCTAALAGLVMMSAGALNKAGLVLGGLFISVLACLPAFRKSNESVRLLKKNGKSDDGQFFLPKVWLQITLLGVGKIMHGIMICTLIGIPLYNMLRQVQWGTDDLVKQIELRQEIEKMHEKEGM